MQSSDEASRWISILINDDKRRIIKEVSAGGHPDGISHYTDEYWNWSLEKLEKEGIKRGFAICRIPLRE